MIKDVELTDTAGIAELLRGLGYNTTQKLIESKLVTFEGSGDYKAMIDTEDGVIHGIIGAQLLNPFHTKGKTGRVTTLVFHESYRGNRAGKALVEAINDYFKASGCLISEVSGNVMQSQAKKFFTGLGYKDGEKIFSKHHG